MDLSPRPLLDTAPDGELFAGRDAALARVEAAARSELNALVVGERGAGKTSLLRQAARRLRERSVDVAFVDGRGATDLESLLELVTAALALDAFVALPDPSPTAIPELAALALLARVVGPGRRPVVLLDELPDGRTGHALFGRFRDELWQLPVAWVVAVATDDRAAVTTPPADAFFTRVVELGPLSPEERRAILVRRAGPDASPSALDAVADACDGTPRHLLFLAREAAADGWRTDRAAAAAADREARLARLSAPARRLVAELEASGPLYASDPAVQARLGWSRVRIVQVLGELADAGLVESARAVGDTGRSRALYSLTTPPTAVSAPTAARRATPASTTRADGGAR